MNNKLTKHHFAWAFLAIVFLVAGVLIYKNLTKDAIDPILRVLSDRLRETDYRLSIFGTSKQGVVWGAKKKALYRIAEDGKSAHRVYSFADSIRSIHVMDNGYIVVATDNDHWSKTEPSTVFLSKDGGREFTEILRFEVSSALWWSITSDNQGNLFVGEYGPREDNNSKRVWRSRDFGQSWEVVFQAPAHDNIHIHRVAVDPYTQHVWVTYGDRPRGTYRSTNGGDDWELIREEHYTVVAFTPEHIFWGEDRRQGRVSQWDRGREKFELIFEAEDAGAFGGSSYNIAYSENELIVPFLKYPDQQHMASVWSFYDQEWNLLITLGTNGGFISIGGPDAAGRVYLQGWIIDKR